MKVLFLGQGESILPLTLNSAEACLCSNKEIEKKIEENKPLEEHIKFTTITLFFTIL